MIFPRRALSIGLIGLSLLLCMLICACTHEPIQPSDTSPSTDPVPDTDPESAPAVTEEESQSDTAPESVEESDTVAPETAPDMEEDPTLNVYPTDGQYIDIGAFFEPDAAHTNAEHYDWLKDAHITYIDSVNWDTAITEEINLLQAQLCEERGIRLSYYPRRYGVDLTTMSDQQLKDYCETLMAKNPSITDLHVIDEPANPWAYAQVLKTVASTGMTPRINFLPYWATWVFENYNGHIEDTVIAVGKESYPTLYFDHYPYDTRRGSIPDMFYNMNLFREIGLKYDLPTGLYLQSFGDDSCRRPNANEIRYQASAALAYGFKSLSYFTWWTTNPPENTHNYAIIAPDGSKTDLYDEVVKINAQITVTGPLLMHLDALEVYHTSGKETGIILRDADELPLYPKSTGSFGFVVSLMEDPDTGRDYIMLVNKNFKKEVTTTITVSDAITYLYDCTNGTYESIDISGGSFEATFLPGGYLLLAVGQKDNVVDRVLDLGDNLAEGKPVSVEAVNPGIGYYAYSVTDGIRDASNSVAKGYRSPANTGYVTVDLGRVVMFNRVDLYPTGTSLHFGEAFPKAFTIDISADGETWKTVVSETDYAPNGGVPVFVLEGTVKAQYVRLTVTEGSDKGYFEIAEIEIYNDKGDIPMPDNTVPDVPEYDSSGNIATTDGVVVICSSAYEEGTFWRIDGINDGRIFDVNEASGLYCGWSSNVFVNKEQEGATEWIGYDFGMPVKVKAVVVHPAQNSMPVPQGFPLSYCVEISDDGVNWTSVYSVEDDPTADQFVSHVLEFDPVTTRYIRFRGTKLTTVGENGMFGYMMQMSEIEVLAG